MGVSVFVSLSLCLIPPSPPVQGPRVQVLPSAVRDHAVRPDPRAPGRSEKVLPAHRPRVSHRTAAWARAGPSAGTSRAGGRHRGRGGGRGGGPVMLHCKQPGIRSSTETSTSDLSVRPVSPQGPPRGSWRTLDLNGWLRIGYLLPPTCTLNPHHPHTHRHAYTHKQTEYLTSRWVQ